MEQIRLQCCQIKPQHNFIEKNKKSDNGTIFREKGTGRGPPHTHNVPQRHASTAALFRPTWAQGPPPTMGYRHANKSRTRHSASLAWQLVLAVDDSRALKHNMGGFQRAVGSARTSAASS